MQDLSPVVFRGESDGKLKPTGGWRYPYFFAERLDQAELYAGRGTQPIACVLQGSNLLDLTEPDPTNPFHRQVVEEVAAQYDDWTCRFSGEARDIWSFLDSGDLYDYEGTGLGERWQALLNVALESFDAVRVLDCTDGTGGGASPVWACRDRSSIRMATLGEELQARLATTSWANVEKWLSREHAGLTERIGRLRMDDEDYRLDRVQDRIPARNFEKMAYVGGSVTLWRALPAAADIRPGDWVGIHKHYAEQHVREQDAGVLKSLQRVQASDVYWAGTDENDFFYLPQAWRHNAESTEAYLKALSADQLRMLCDGEQSLITRHESAIAAVKDHVLGKFDQQLLGEFHGPDHWARVCVHGHAVARSLAVDPLIAHIFAWVHDSQREDEGIDPEHGLRAANFVADQRSALFSFLDDGQVEQLKHACRLHSDGMTEAEAVVQSCWDADRLDLWRVGIEPHPTRLCTPYAKQRQVIEAAQDFLFADEIEAHRDQISEG